MKKTIDKWNNVLVDWANEKGTEEGRHQKPSSVRQQHRNLTLYGKKNTLKGLSY